MFEDRPDKDTPPRITAALMEYGGLSPSGKPIWQLVLASNCKTRCFGRMNHVAKGSTARAVDGDWTEEKKFSPSLNPASIVPNRIEEGEFWVPAHDGAQGWLLRRWLPASAWGTKEQWESERAPDERTRLLAAYPQSADYMPMPGCQWLEIPPIDILYGAIRNYNLQQRSNPVNWENHIQLMAAREQEKRQQAADAYAEELEAQYRLGIEGMVRTVSRSAQKVRNVMAHEVAGVNLGASEKWGS